MFDKACENCDASAKEIICQCDKVLVLIKMIRRRDNG